MHTIDHKYPSGQTAPPKTIRGKRRRLLQMAGMSGLMAAMIVMASCENPSVPVDELVLGKTFGGLSDDRGYAIANTADGGYVLAGHTASYASGVVYMWLLKTNGQGKEEWSSFFEGDTVVDNEFVHNTARAVQQCNDGGYILAGETTSSGNGLTDFWLAKTGPDGGQAWAHTFGGPGYDAAYAVEQTTDGGYIIGGYTRSFGAGGADFWLVKTDSDGSEVWNRTFGGAGDDYGYAVVQTSDGGYILVGAIELSTANGYDILLLKTNDLGEESWRRTYGGTGVDVGNSVRQTGDGGYIISGATTSQGAGYYDVWLIKVDSDGTETWNRNHTFGGADDDLGECVQQTSDGGYIVVGRTRSSTAEIYGQPNYDAWMIKTDAEGKASWTKKLGGREHDYGTAIVQNPAGGYAITGRTLSFGAGADDLWLVLTDSEGKVLD